MVFLILIVFLVIGCLPVSKTTTGTNSKTVVKSETSSINVSDEISVNNSVSEIDALEEELDISTDIDEIDKMLKELES